MAAVALEDRNARDGEDFAIWVKTLPPFRSVDELLLKE
jgi:hypothetical protein